MKNSVAKEKVRKNATTIPHAKLKLFMKKIDSPTSARPSFIVKPI
jgi:hypothetical protein